MNYRIFDLVENCFLTGSYQKRSTASKKADRLDLEYGAIRYSVRFIPVTEQTKQEISL